ncbi:MAG: hypothetical protein ABJB74_12880 [Gemmatimonas sp.]
MRKYLTSACRLLQFVWCGQRSINAPTLDHRFSPATDKMKPMVAFDESANSGANLLDPEQPILTCTSVLVTEEEVEV